MKPTAVVIALLAVIAVLALQFENSSDRSRNALDRISQSSEIVLGFHTDRFPMSFETATGAPAGYSIELCRQVVIALRAHLNQEGIQTRFLRLASGNPVSAIQDGTIDMDCGAAIIASTDPKHVEYSVPIYVADGSVLSLRRSAIKSIRDLESRKVGIIDKDPTAAKLRRQLHQKNVAADLIVVASDREGVLQLNDGKIDALISDPLSLLSRVNETQKPAEYSVAQGDFATQRYALVLPADDAEFLALVNQTLIKLHRSGRSAAIHDAWIGRTGLQSSAKSAANLSAVYQDAIDHN